MEELPDGVKCVTLGCAETVCVGGRYVERGSRAVDELNQSLKPQIWKYLRLPAKCWRVKTAMVELLMRKYGQCIQRGRSLVTL